MLFGAERRLDYRIALGRPSKMFLPDKLIEAFANLWVHSSEQLTSRIAVPSIVATPRCLTHQDKFPCTVATRWRATGLEGLASGTPAAISWFSMVRANCRERFIAADFDFVVRTLSRSQSDHVSLVELLSDSETRDSVLDNPNLVDAILSNAGQLCISSQFYFYILARHVLREVGIADRKLCDYVASLLETFSRANGLHAPHASEERGRQYVSDILIALTHATSEQAFLLRAHVGNYSLFLTGIFHENTQKRSQRGAPDLAFYERIGRTNYQLVASHVAARRCELSDVYENLADRFRDVRLALNRLSDQLLNLDEDIGGSLVS